MPNKVSLNGSSVGRPQMESRALARPRRASASYPRRATRASAGTTSRRPEAAALERRHRCLPNAIVRCRKAEYARACSGSAKKRPNARLAR